ncbi:MAG TPA: HAMP domain-containing sensor histidine kinase [Candidatus Dormibacteraeota bacterium]|nr:HAMP domain-containing sensor histidine kinase [Candidatus Dormibacteraeota bacterium]
MRIPNDHKATIQPQRSSGEEVARLTAENSALKVELSEARKSNQQYLQNVAHQLTAPLGAIKWSIEALKDPEVSLSRKSKLLSSIYSQATILVHLIKNFALMSNLEADLELGQFRERPEPVDILRLCINLANDFQPQAAENEKKIVVDEDSFAGTLQGKKVQMVKNLVAQALSNLLENAVKYSDSRSTIVISAEQATVDKIGDTLVISVRSTGLPIKTDENEQLFKRGFRGSTAKQKVPAGTGIGLYLAKRVMVLHQGAIGLKTTGRDSRFKLMFPLSRLV